MTFNESNTVEAFVRDRLKAIGWESIDRATRHSGQGGN